MKNNFEFWPVLKRGMLKMENFSGNIYTDFREMISRKLDIDVTETISSRKWKILNTHEMDVLLFDSSAFTVKCGRICLSRLSMLKNGRIR